MAVCSTILVTLNGWVGGKDFIARLYLFGQPLVSHITVVQDLRTRYKNENIMVIVISVGIKIIYTP